MRNTVAVMNTKGGVGKSTIVLALAETLAAHHGKNVLVIDSDAQASVSSMLMTVNSLHKLQSQGLTIVDYLVGTVLQKAPTDWQSYVVRNVSDVDDARSVYLIPSDMQLTLLEREVSKESAHAQLRASIGHLLASVSGVFDVVLIDCPPGLSILTESWLREAAFHLSPTKADYVSICGLEVFRRFKAFNPEMGFAENLGVLINLFDASSASDREYLRWLNENAENRCFAEPIPRSNALQDAARYTPPDRSFTAKYPGVGGQAIRRLTEELLARMAASAAEHAARAAAPMASPQGVQPPSQPVDAAAAAAAAVAAAAAAAGSAPVTVSAAQVAAGAVQAASSPGPDVVTVPAAATPEADVASPGVR
jgi:chromosome partitioning protein